MWPTGAAKSGNLSAVMETNTSKLALGRAAVSAAVIIKFGLDWHATQVTVCRQIDGQLPQPSQKLSEEQLLALVADHHARGHRVLTCYEAGACGYQLHRKLTALGAVNFVVAPRRWDERGQRVKTDKRDARELCQRLDRYLAGNTAAFTIVYVPTPHQEQVRALCRQRATVMKERQRCELRGHGLMLAQGIQAPGGWWQPDEWATLASQLPAWLREHVERWQRDAVRLEAELAQLTPRIEALSAGKRAPKGLGALTAAILESEIMDWSRFTNRRQPGSYSGLCPSEDSSNQRRRQGSVNKHGNVQVRHLLVEAIYTKNSVRCPSEVALGVLDRRTVRRVGGSAGGLGGRTMAASPPLPRRPLTPPFTMNIRSPLVRLVSSAALATVLLLSARVAAAPAAPAVPAAAEPLPRLERRGRATQLIVDGKPYLVLGGEATNTAASDVGYMQTVWPRLAKLGLNTALIGIAWDWIEPQEGRFDFSRVDAMLRQARAQRMHVIVVWFGSWKNGLSSFAPAWVKRDERRFPRVRIAGGEPLEILSTFSAATRDADARAFAALFHHLRDVDPQHTVIMCQVENEVGVLGDSRDRSAAANLAFQQDVPAALIARIRSQAAWPALRRVWQVAGGRASGTWSEVFGHTAAADEIFQAWHYARYLDHVAAAGKAELDLPLFTNTWIVQPEDKGPGDYPSGGPEPLTLDVWRVGAPHIDLNCPDIYLPDFAGWCARFHRPDNPLFVPESRGDAAGVANAFYAIGEHSAIGYSPFGIDRPGRLLALRPGPNQPPLPAVGNLPLVRGYAVLREMEPLILAAQERGAIAAVSLNRAHRTQEVPLGNYTLKVELRKNRRDPADVPPLGYAMLINVGTDEYYVAGCEVQVTFLPRPATGEIASIASAETGSFVHGVWKPVRQMNGDDVLLRYDLAAAAVAGESGSGLRFFGPYPTVQHVVLYRYR